MAVRSIVTTAKASSATSRGSLLEPTPSVISAPDCQRCPSRRSVTVEEIEGRLAARNGGSARTPGTRLSTESDVETRRPCGQNGERRAAGRDGWPGAGGGQWARRLCVARCHQADSGCVSRATDSSFTAREADGSWSFRGPEIAREAQMTRHTKPPPSPHLRGRPASCCQPDCRPAPASPSAAAGTITRRSP